MNALKFGCQLLVLLALESCIDVKPAIQEVFAVIETTPAKALAIEDAADDPAIWVNPVNPEKSLIIGTNKKAGLSLFNLNGEELFFIPSGNTNNVDLRSNVTLINGDSLTIVACSERINNEVLVYTLDTSKTALILYPGGRIPSKLSEVYGFCLYHSSKTKHLFAFVNDKEGLIEQWHIKADSNGLQTTLVRQLKLSSQTEGMVADDEWGILYVGEEDKGIWKFDAEPDGPTTPVFVEGSDASNPKIEHDIEGLAIYKKPNQGGYLIASSQGNNSYAVFERTGQNKYLGSFKIGNGVVDGTEDTDGIEVTSTPLGTAFPNGILVVQDGANVDEGKLKPQNFKIVDWLAVEGILSDRVDQ